MRMHNLVSGALLKGLVILSFCMTSAAQAAGNGSISGVVTDGAGKPVRGAIVKATLGTKTSGRYSDNAGRYRITGVEPGKYQVVVDAFGFDLAEQTVDATRRGDTNFKLSPKMDLARLHDAELKYLFPETREAEIVYHACSTCHGLETVIARAGMAPAGWLGFLPKMNEERWGHQVGFPPQFVARMVPNIVQFFGPEGLFAPGGNPDLSKVKSTPLVDAAFKAKVAEYMIPMGGKYGATRGPMAHSVTVDDKTGLVWFSEYDALANHLVKFDPATETFQEFPNPVPAAHAHTGVVLKDGRFVVGLDIGTYDGGGPASDPRATSPHDSNGANKLAIVSPNGHVEIFKWPENPHGARVVRIDPANDGFVWIVAETQVWHFNLNTKQAKVFNAPIAETYPEGAFAALGAAPGSRPARVHSFGYDATVDSKGIPWVTQLNLGNIFRVDPATGETKIYHTPELRSARGIAADADDNLWIGDFYGHKLVKLDQKTGKFTFFQPPTPYASPYGITVDKRRGYIWYADTNGNNAVRFDPKTGSFVEYPLLTQNAAVRFMGVDPRGRVWYGGFYNQRLGMIDPGYEDDARSVAVRNRGSLDVSGLDARRP